MIRPEFTPSPGMDATPVYEAADPQLKALFGALNGAVAALDLGQPHTPAPPRWALNVHANLLNVTPGPDWTDEEFAYCLRLRAVANQPGGANPKMVTIAAAAAPGGTHTTVPMDIYLYLPGYALLTDTQQACLDAEMRRAITDVAGFEIIGLPTDDDCAFTLDDGPGFDFGCLSL